MVKHSKVIKVHILNEDGHQRYATFWLKSKGERWKHLLLHTQKQCYITKQHSMLQKWSASSLCISDFDT